NQLDFGFKVKKFFDAATGKDVYSLDKSQTSFFTMKQLQYNIYRSFKVKQTNRHQIVKQVKKILQDDFEKYIVRTDIESFYESVPQSKLFEIIEGNQLLSPKSTSLIKNLIYQFNVLSGELAKPADQRKGVPRGAGVSAYLAELYMRTVDERIKQLPDIIFYGRYVDDIIAIFSPLKTTKSNYYLDSIDIIVKEQGLKLKKSVPPAASKTYEVNTFNSAPPKSLEFLGYRFDIANKKYSGIFLSKNKISKYTIRLESTFDSFIRDSKYDYKKATKLLIHRLNYLTKNTHLQKPKKGITGIYYSNSLLENDSPCLEALNLILNDLINLNVPHALDPALNVRLKKFCFRKGFVNKLFFNISSKNKNIPDLRSASAKALKPIVNNFERIVFAWK
ncbi:MAG TPA: antiviral reverse transcriptase Drt3a, partial [Flavobacterium sp.]|nr:antiviral reverse transcriptase Drt3a [Flavobacterium sp.]